MPRYRGVRDHADASCRLGTRSGSDGRTWRDRNRRRDSETRRLLREELRAGVSPSPALEGHSTADDGEIGPESAEAVGRRCQKVIVEHDEVAELADFNRATGRFVEAE